MIIDESELKEKSEHLASLYTGADRPFDEVLRADRRESFYISDHGHILRVISIDGLFDSDQSKPAILEFYNFHGNHIGSITKRFESRAAFALLFTEDVRHAIFYELESRPLFISLANDGNNVNSLLPLVPRRNTSRAVLYHSPEL